MNPIEHKYQILSGTNVGMEFELYSELSPKEVDKSLSFALVKKVVIPIIVKDLKTKNETTYHSKAEATSTQFKLERDYSGGKDMYELVTGPLPYEEARLIIIKTNQWIKINGWTDSKCAIHLNVSFDKFKSDVRIPINSLNVLKFILGFDEDFIYSRFPERKDSVYAKSINNFYPVNRFIFFDKPENIDRNEFVVPNEKYYGVNFTKLAFNYLELRYLGGQGYEKRTYKILEILEYFIFRLYECLQQNEFYTSSEKDKLYKTLAVQKKSVQSFVDPEKFLLGYPNIQVTVDMNGQLEVLKSYWTTVRDVLFSLIVESGLREGHLNLDTDLSRFQLRDGKMKKANHLKDLELFDCEVSGTMTNCEFYRCKISSSLIEDCKLLEVNEVFGSKIKNTIIKDDNEVFNSYIENPTAIIDGKIEGGVIRRGIIGKNAEISRYTLIVDSTGEGKHDNKKDGDSYHDAFSKKEK